jgi:hypothetical protein
VSAGVCALSTVELTKDTAGAAVVPNTTVELLVNPEPVITTKPPVVLAAVSSKTLYDASAICIVVINGEAELARMAALVFAEANAAAATEVAIVATVLALFAEAKLLATDASSLSEVIAPRKMLFAVIFAMLLFSLN